MMPVTPKSDRCHGRRALMLGLLWPGEAVLAATGKGAGAGPGSGPLDWWTMGVVIVLASQGLVNLPTGIARAFGANIGTCATALLAAIGKPREAVRAALVHVLFNVAGVAIFVGLIDQLGLLAQWIPPAHPELSGSARQAAEVPRQIANAHTLFNLVNTLIFIGFTGQFARLVEWLVPDRPLGEKAPAVRAKYLDEELLATPSLALDRAAHLLLRQAYGEDREDRDAGGNSLEKHWFRPAH